MSIVDESCHEQCPLLEDKPSQSETKPKKFVVLNFVTSRFCKIPQNVKSSKINTKETARKLTNPHALGWNPSLKPAERQRAEKNMPWKNEKERRKKKSREGREGITDNRNNNEARHGQIGGIDRSTRPSNEKKRKSTTECSMHIAPRALVRLYGNTGRKKIPGSGSVRFFMRRRNERRSERRGQPAVVIETIGTVNSSLEEGGEGDEG